MNSRIEELRAQIAALEAQAEPLRQELVKAYVEAARKTAIQLSTEGWQRFVFESSYYGSHPERGGCDIKYAVWFRPGLDLTRWIAAGFSHGEHGCSDDESAWNSWLEALEEGPDFRYD